jgi:hypothetical protein
MSALVVHEPCDARHEDLLAPNSGRGEVRIGMKAAGVLSSEVPRALVIRTPRSAVWQLLRDGLSICGAWDSRSRTTSGEFHGAIWLRNGCKPNCRSGTGPAFRTGKRLSWRCDRGASIRNARRRREG